MSDLPRARSYPQILGDIQDAFLADQDLPGLPPGDPLLSLFEAAAQSDLRTTQDTFGLLGANDLDKATGLALLRKGQEEGVEQISESPSVGAVDITDTSFTKLVSKIFQGLPAPILGSFTLYVQDASLWPATGSVYIGRGTSNYEGALAYSAKAQVGTYWQLTLSQAITKLHSVGESVILAQGGNRIVGEATIVKTPQSNVSDAVEFRTVYQVIIPDGETSVSGVVVACQQPGVIGNVPARSISEFASAPFDGATVSNPLPFSNGRETESDDSYRGRIRDAKRTRSKGTPLAIKVSVNGIGSADESKRVTSAEIVTRTGAPTTLYIDDGTGYEELIAGSAVEVLIDSATGGEEFFQTKRKPIAKACLISRNQAPFTLTNGNEVTVRVGGKSYTFRFVSTQFNAIESASAYEVVTAINSESELGFLARTAESGTRVVLFAKEDTNEDIEIIGGDVDEIFRFPAGTAYTIQLYKNDRLLIKDGLKAVSESNLFSEWDAMSGAQTLEIAVDGTPAQTYTFVDQDFVNQATGYTTLAKNDQFAWAKVINSKVPGITATVNDGRILLTSNAGVLSTASVEIVNGTLVAARMFTSGTVVGKAKEYELNRNNGQIRLVTALATGDRLSVGSQATRSFLESAALPATTTVVDSNVWFSVDGDAERISVGLSSANPISISIDGIYDGGHLLKIATTVPAFLNVREGDWMIVYDVNVDTSLFGNFRVAEVERDVDGEVVGTWITIERKTAVLARDGHRTVALPPVGGDIAKVLTIGGCTRPHNTDLASSDFEVEGTTAACEIFDPNTGLSAPVASMATSRAYHTATVLANGKVLVTGGISANGTILSTTEIYDPTLDTWSAGPALTAAVSHHSATLLLTNDVHICGGHTGRNISLQPVVSTMSCRYNAGAGTITPAGTLNAARANHRTILLADGRVLIAGGLNTTTTLASAEIYNNAGPACVAVAPMTVARRDFGIAIFGSTPVVVGNFRGSENTSSYETYNVGGDAWTIDQISSTKYIFCESHDLLPSDGSNVYAMNCWYETADGVKTPVVVGWDNISWTEALASGLNSSYTIREKQWVEVHSTDLSTSGQMIGVGGYDPYGDTVAQVEWFSTNAFPAWPTDVLDPAVTAVDLNLETPPGMVFVRSEEPLQKIVVPAGSNYTATSLASALNDFLVGATATTYKTNRLRVTTNSHGMEGDIALVAADTVAADLIDIEPADAIDNLVGHMASVESGNGEAGTPTFEQVESLGISDETDPDFWAKVTVSIPDMGGGHQLVGLRNDWPSLPGTLRRRFGSNLNARLVSGFVTGGTGSVDATQVDIRTTTPSGEILAHDRFYAGAPFAIGPFDDFVVQVDNDLNKRYAIPMWRKLKPGTNVYGLTNTFKDADAGNVSLALTFGLDYGFDNFTVYMKARAVAFSGDASRKTLFRFHRVGPDGEYARVRFSNPDDATASLSVVTTNKGAQSDVRIKLPSGALRTPTLRSTSRIASACTGQTGSVGTLVFAVGFSTTVGDRIDANDETRIRLQLPPLTTDCGISPGETVYLQSTNGGFSSDGYLVNSKDAASGPGGTQDIYVVDLTASDLTVIGSIGTISLDSQGQCLFSGAGIVAGDYFRIEDTTDVDANYVEETFRIGTVAAQYLICTSGEAVFAAGDVSPALDSEAINNVDYVKIFASAPPTISTIVSTVNGLAAVDNSVVPITLVNLGTGAGTIDRSTPEELLSQDWYQLADGVNWVSKTDSPINTSGDYDLTFKKEITGSLSVTADWSNEEVRICPTTTANIVNWFNTPAASGLYASCTIQASADGAKVQIASRTPGFRGSVQVQGGLGNSASAEIKGDTVSIDSHGVSTVLRSLTDGFVSGMWVGIDNSLTVPKSGLINNATELQSWGVDGLVTLNSNVYTTWLEPGNATMMFEKQGDFVAISTPGLDQTSFKVKSISRNSITELHTMVVLVPVGQISTGWQPSDKIFFQNYAYREIVRAEKVNTGNYFLDLKLKDGETALDYITGDTFEVTSNSLAFPIGTYTVVNQVTQLTGAVRIECTHFTPSIVNLTLNYTIGLAVRVDTEFSAEEVTLVSVGDYDSGDGTVTVTFNTSAPFDTSRDWLGYANEVFSWGAAIEGDIVSIVAPATTGNGRDLVPAQNQGTFRIVRIDSVSDTAGRPGTIWIENTNAVEGTFFARVSAFDYNSIMPGDLMSVNTVLWGSENRGSWIVDKVGVNTADSDEQFVNTKTFKVSLATRTPKVVGNPGPLGEQSALVQIIEGKAARLIKRIDGISPNQDDGTYSDIRWDNDIHMQQISAQSGSVVSALDKLAFSTTLAGGVDGYSYNKGLIAEANRIIYGDPADTSNYPGVAAAGSQINISGPLVRRLKIALQIRVRTGSSYTDIADRVRSAVAAYINQIGVGKPVSGSGIIEAANKVVGVTSVVVLSPSFDAENDLISIQPYEKPLIVNLAQDISITYAGQ